MSTNPEPKTSLPIVLLLATIGNFMETVLLLATISNFVETVLFLATISNFVETVLLLATFNSLYVGALGFAKCTHPARPLKIYNVFTYTLQIVVLLTLEML